MLDISQEAEHWYQTMGRSHIAFAYFDANDRLARWNHAYVDLNFRIRDLIRSGVRFTDLLDILIQRGQIAIPEGARESWVTERLRTRRHGGTAFRKLTDGRTFLAQERKDSSGGTMGFWLDVSDMFDRGVLQGSGDLSLLPPCSMNDAGCQDLIRRRLQTILMSLEFLSTVAERNPEQTVIHEAIAATCDIRTSLDQMRA